MHRSRCTQQNSEKSTIAKTLLNLTNELQIKVRLQRNDAFTSEVYQPTQMCTHIKDVQVHTFTIGPTTVSKQVQQSIPAQSAHINALNNFFIMRSDSFLTSILIQPSMKYQRRTLQTINYPPPY